MVNFAPAVANLRADGLAHPMPSHQISICQIHHRLGLNLCALSLEFVAFLCPPYSNSNSNSKTAVNISKGECALTLNCGCSHAAPTFRPQPYSNTFYSRSHPCHRFASAWLFLSASHLTSLSCLNSVFLSPLQPELELEAGRSPKAHRLSNGSRASAKGSTSGSTDAASPSTDVDVDFNAGAGAGAGADAEMEDEEEQQPAGEVKYPTLSEYLVAGQS